jgi:hypothetical protein
MANRSSMKGSRAYGAAALLLAALFLFCREGRALHIYQIWERSHRHIPRPARQASG